ncbi:MAG: DUF86 domain-containing protein [Oscillospiraceae bacterium]|nr:DUF86 domain-containing protein [Oscillospiraceae bacterium]
MKNRDIMILKKITQYCGEIAETIERFELTFDMFDSDIVPRYTISMCILQIGELANKLTPELRATYNEVPWRDIISMRHRAVHDYESVDMETLWNIVTKNVPVLKKYCETILVQIEEKEG